MKTYDIVVTTNLDSGDKHVGMCIRKEDMNLLSGKDTCILWFIANPKYEYVVRTSDDTVFTSKVVGNIQKELIQLNDKVLEDE